MMETLGAFAAFIREKRLEEYHKDYISHFKTLKIPIMRLFTHLSDEQLSEMSRPGTLRFLDGFIHGTALEQAAESLRQWETDTIPGISKKALLPSDLVLIYAAQKYSLYRFLPHYTDNVEKAVIIIRELEEYYSNVQDKAIQMLFRVQKETEAELEKKNKQLEEAQMLAHIGSWEWDLDDGKVWCSTELYNIFGLEPREERIESSYFREFMHNNDMTIEKYREALDKDNHFTFEFSIKRPNGEVRAVLSRGEVQFDEKDKPVKSIGTLQDITEIREAEVQRELNKQKDEFISIASHELKTPLTSLKAYVQLIDKTLDKELHKEAGNYVKKAIEFTGKLERLISDLLDVSKIEAGKLQFTMEDFDFDKLVHDCIEMTRHSAPDYEIVLQGNSGAIVHGDKQRLEQVLLNYLSNAVKYSPRNKKVLVNVECSKEHVQVDVSDHGIGIPMELQGRIFERFFRVNTASHQFQGLGIGLYISAEIIRRHNGKVWVESQEGEGSTFHFRLPVQ
jgi:two-component system CheB/CheR fusion protein